MLLELDMGWEIVDGEVVEKVGLVFEGLWGVEELVQRCVYTFAVTSWNADMKENCNGHEC